MEPPPFQEAARCDVCKCSFNTFRRRHHCRCCGRTLCHEHSSNQKALPQFDIHVPVRVCADCFNDSSRPEKDNIRASFKEADSVTDGVFSLTVEDNVKMQTGLTAGHQPMPGVVECKCGMPLCICEAPAPPVNTLPLQKKPLSVSVPQSNPKPMKTEPAFKNKGSTSNSKPSFSSVFNRGQVYNGVSDISQINYEVNGEGLREAIKNSDTAAVKKLLSQGVDANYHDKQGSSLLHLAAVFNQTEIVFTLMDSGASLNYENAQGETPLDCAPVTLQYKMREKMKENEQFGQQ